METLNTENMKNLIKQIRLKENQINNIEEIAGNYPTEEKQIELNCLYSELRELKKKQAKATADDMKRMTFGESESIKPNKSVQEVLFDEEVVGWLYTSYKSVFSPIEEVFWSINLTKEQADRVSSNNDESEDVGFYQVNLSLSDTKQYEDLYVIAKKIYYVKRK